MSRIIRMQPASLFVLACAGLMFTASSSVRADDRYSSPAPYIYGDFSSEDSSALRASVRRELASEVDIAPSRARGTYSGASTSYSEAIRTAAKPTTQPTVLTTARPNTRTVAAQMDNAVAPDAPPAGQPPMVPPPVAGAVPPPQMNQAGCNCGGSGITCGDGVCCGGSCTAGPCGEGLFAPGVGDWHFGMRPGQWYIGTDYLATQVHMSKADAFVRITTQTDRAGNVNQTNDVINFEFDRQSSVRAFLGYHLCCCDADVQFTYSRMEGSAHLTGTAANGVVIDGHGELAAIAPGDTLAANTDVHANVYDITFHKKITPCCQDCNCCPTWAFSWMGGYRIADVSRDFSEREQFGFLRHIDIDAQYTGAGPMVGLEARRYMCQGKFSTYATSDIAMLLGDYEHHIRREAPNGLIDTVETQNFSISRVIPVLDIEVGASWKPNCHWTIEGGWLMQAWFDLGMSEQHILDGQPFAEPLDTSNILGFDGLFARVQYAF